MLNRIGFDDENDVERTGNDYLHSDIIVLALTEASGLLDAALSVAHMYDANEMARLTDHSKSLRDRIVCDLAVCLLFQRRDIAAPEGVLRQREEAEKYLDRIRHGERLFVLVDSEAHQDAGLPDLVAPRNVERIAQNDITTRASGFFPRERARLNNNLK